MRQEMPAWIRKFSIKIENEDQTMLLLPEETNPENFSFIDSLGATDGSKISVLEKEYVIKTFELYANNNEPYGYSLDLHIIVYNG